MKKYEIDHLTKRIGEVVLCTNGSISTKIDKRRKKTGLTDARKLSMIETGKAILRPLPELMDGRSGYHDPLHKGLLECFTYPLTDGQKEKIKFNDTLDDKVESLHTEVELEGKRLLDRAVLGIVSAEQIPDELHKLGEMVNLAV